MVHRKIGDEIGRAVDTGTGFISDSTGGGGTGQEGGIGGTSPVGGLFGTARESIGGGLTGFTGENGILSGLTKGILPIIAIIVFLLFLPMIIRSLTGNGNGDRGGGDGG